jgi:hypothetical protein
VTSIFTSHKKTEKEVLASGKNALAARIRKIIVEFLIAF